MTLALIRIKVLVQMVNKKYGLVQDRKKYLDMLLSLSI